MPKTNAEMCRQYRRKKNENKIKIKKNTGKSSTERSREFRARKKQLLNNQNICSNISVNVTDVINGTSTSDSFTQLHAEEQNVVSDDSNKNYIEFQSIKSEFPEENQLHAEEQNVASDDSNKNYTEFQSIKSEFPEENDCEEPQEEEYNYLKSDSRENIIENQNINREFPIERVCEEQEELQQCKPKQKRGFHKLIQTKIELVNLQKQLVIEEMEQKLIQRRILETEMVHKNDIYHLEKQHLLLKIELLKKDLENNK